MSRRLVSMVVAFAALVVASPARADIASDMAGFFDDMNLANVTRPGVYEGQSAGYFTGGGVYLRTPPRSYTLYSVQWPRFRAGCGGIDLFTGGFSFINASEFVDMLQSIGSAAASHAFLLALSTISPKIASVMEQVQTWAQRYGLNSINACEAGARLVGGALDVFGKEKQACIMERTGLHGDSWSEAERACTTGGLRRATQAGGRMRRLAFTEGNLAWRAMMRNGFFAADPALAEVMMNLSGTVVIRVIAPDDEDTETEHRVVPSILVDSQGRRLVEALLEGGTVRVLGCTDPSPSEDGCTTLDADVPVTISADRALVPRVRALLDAMVTKISADQPLDDAERGLLSATALPVYKYLTVSAAFMGTTLRSDVAQYAALIARDILYTYLNDLLGKMVASVRALDVKADAQVATFLDGITEARRAVHAFKTEVAQSFDEALVLTERTRAYEQAVVSRLAPGLFRPQVLPGAR
ncbi:MAG: conjugal transfer protein TraH [Chromatiales bacterium]|nr:conjugal transfer protein TraH [Chromatiales bacterium]